MIKINNTKITYISIFGLLFIAILALLIMLPNTASAQSVGTYQGYNTTTYANSPQPYDGYTYPPTGGTTNNGVNNPIPVIFSLSPSIVSRNSFPVIITINGNNFVPGVKVKLNGIDQVTNYINSSRLEISLNSVNTLGIGNFNVNAYNPLPGGGYSNNTILTVNSTTISTNTSRTSTRNSTTTSSNTNTNNTAPNTNIDEVSNEGLAAGAIFGSGDGFLPSGLIQWLIFFIFILALVFLVRKIFFADQEHAKPMKHA